jgi:hypothetical protein
MILHHPRVYRQKFAVNHDIADIRPEVPHPRIGFTDPLPRQPSPIRVYGLLNYPLAGGAAPYPDFEYGRRVHHLSKDGDNIGRMNSSKRHWFIRCEPEVLARLKAINWRKETLPTASTPTLTKGEVVRGYRAHMEATRRALPTEFVAEPDSSWEPIGPFLRYGIDVASDQPASSVIPSTSPQYEQVQKSTDGGGVPSDEYVSWWAERVEQFKRDLRPDGPLIVHIKETVTEDQQSTCVLQLKLAMRRLQPEPHNTLFVLGCCE